MSDFYGPALPPGFTAQQCEEEESKEGCNVYVPQLPGKAGHEESSSAGRTYGPALPPGLGSAASNAAGPAETDTAGPDATGPNLQLRQQESGSDDDEDFIVGPLPISQQKKEQLEREQRRANVEARAEKMMDHLTGKDRKEADGPKREEWMTELPPEIKAFGLGPRKFRTREVVKGDRSVWTDTPADRLRKQQEKGEGKVRNEKTMNTPLFVSERDQKLAAQVSDYNKTHRAESLVDMHRKRRAEEQEDTKGVRRPFDREVDLKLPQNRVTPAKRQALMKDSASALKNKFSHGSQRFL